MGSRKQQRQFQIELLEHRISLSVTQHTQVFTGEGVSGVQEFTTTPGVGAVGSFVFNVAHDPQGQGSGGDLSGPFPNANKPGV